MGIMDYVRDGARIFVGLGVFGVFLYLVVVGRVSVDTFESIAVPVLALYLGLDGVARPIARNANNK